MPTRTRDRLLARAMAGVGRVMLRYAAHARGVLLDQEATLRDLPQPPATWTVESRARYRDSIMRRVDIYHRVAAEEIAFSVTSGTREAAERIIKALKQPVALVARVVRGITGPMGGSSGLTTLYQTHLNKNRVRVVGVVDRYLAAAQSRGIQPRAVRTDLNRVLGGKPSQLRALHGLTEKELTPLRSIRHRSRLLAITEIHDHTREAGMDAMQAGGVIGATFRTGPLHRKVDRCDDFVGQKFRFDQWPRTHPRCGCRPGPPFLFGD